MSKSYWLTLTLTITVVSGWSSIAMAQFGGGSNPQGNSPTISPYINLLRGGNTGLNYYGLVRPQQDFVLQNQQLGQGIQSLQMQQMQQGSQMQMNRGYGYSQLGMTGHPVIFNSFGNGQFSGGYFGMGGGGGFNGGGGDFGGGNFGGGGGQFGGPANFGGIGTTGGGFGGVSSGFGGVSGHMSQFGGIGNTYRAGR